jgi:hypothetical protein
MVLPNWDLISNLVQQSIDYTFLKTVKCEGSQLSRHISVTVVPFVDSNMIKTSCLAVKSVKGKHTKTMRWDKEGVYGELPTELARFEFWVESVTSRPLSQKLILTSFVMYLGERTQTKVLGNFDWISKVQRVLTHPRSPNGSGVVISVN